MTLVTDRPPKVWGPLKGSQTLSLSCPTNIVFFHGTRGPGKSDGQLMDFRKFVGVGYGAFWRGILLDREYKNLDDLVSKSKRWFSQFDDGARFLSSTADYKWVWPTGEELLFRTVKRDDDYWNYHGQEFPWMGWNELTKFPNPILYQSMMSCNRSSFLPADYPQIRLEKGKKVTYFLPEIPLRVFATANPYGVGHNWVKQEFIDPAPSGQIVRKTKNVFNPRTQQREDVTKTQVAIFGSYRENRFLSPEYVLELESIQDPNKKKAWLYGDWSITSGGMFDDLWSSQHNVLKGFKIPHHWRMFRSFDWGSSAPFSVGWWTESDGSDIQLADGTWRSTLKGDLFRIAEWYGWTGVANQGVRMLARDIAKGIAEREMRWGIWGRVKPGPADSSIYDEVNGNCIGRDMAKKIRIGGKLFKGIKFVKANKAPGTRHTGWELMRQAIFNAQPMENGSPREYPGLFIFSTCDQFIRTVVTIPRDTKDLDDVDTNAEDHIADDCRYVVLSTGNRFVVGSTVGMF